jgi:eukaryotic-like serine/threonine-protein kinase
MMLSRYVNKVPGRYEDGAANARKAIELDPDFGIGYYNFAVNNAYLQRLERPRGALQRAAGRGLEMDEFLMLAYDIAFLRNDPAAMERVSARARGRFGPESGSPIKSLSPSHTRVAYIKARNMSRRAVAEAQQGKPRGKGQASRKPEQRSVKLFSGKRLMTWRGGLRTIHRSDSATCRCFARLALNHREPAKAIEVLQTAAANELGAPRSVIHALLGALYPIYERGKAYIALHQGAKAAVEFQKILGHPRIGIADSIGAGASATRQSACLGGREG